MTLIEKQILDLLQEGKSYREIQGELNVSPSKVSSVKYKYSDEINGNYDASSASSDSATSSGSGSATTELLVGQLTENQHEIIPPPDCSSNTEALLQIRKLELEHERLMKEMELEERDKEREFELNKMQHKNSITENAVNNLKRKIESLEEQIQEIEEENSIVDFDDSDEADIELEDDFIFEIPDELQDEFKEYIEKFISWDGGYWDEEDVEKETTEITNIREKLENVCDEEFEDYTELDEWQILKEAEDFVQEIGDKLKNRIFNIRKKFKFSEEWLKRLEESI